MLRALIFDFDGLIPDLKGIRSHSKPSESA